LPVDKIEAPEILRCLERIEDRGAGVTAHRTRGVASQVFRFAIARGLTSRDPAIDLRGALAPVATKNFPAVTDPSELVKLLKLIDAYRGTFTVKSALRLLPLVFARPGELRHARWENIDLTAKAWAYFSTKRKVDHVIPLSRQAIDILADLRPLTRNDDYVFPNARVAGKPISENTINKALRSLGVSREEMCGHGFRATARTLLDEALGYRPDFIEEQLSHAVRDPNGRAYNRTKFLKERTEMMQS